MNTGAWPMCWIRNGESRWCYLKQSRCQSLVLIQFRRLGHGHDDVIKWKHFPRNWPFVRGIHRSPVNSPHKSQWRGTLMFSLIYVWIHGWVNNREAGDLRRYRARYDVTVMIIANASMVSITHPYSNFNGTLHKPTLKLLGHGWIISSHRFMQM